MIKVGDYVQVRSDASKVSSDYYSHIGQVTDIGYTENDGIIAEVVFQVAFLYPEMLPSAYLALRLYEIEPALVFLDRLGDAYIETLPTGGCSTGDWHHAVIPVNNGYSILADGRTIAEVRPATYQYQTTALRNAAVIASAKELLHALQSLLDSVHGAWVIEKGSKLDEDTRYAERVVHNALLHKKVTP